MNNKGLQNHRAIPARPGRSIKNDNPELGLLPQAARTAVVCGRDLKFITERGDLDRALDERLWRSKNRSAWLNVHLETG
jgi:hypothetical protein